MHGVEVVRPTSAAWACAGGALSLGLGLTIATLQAQVRPAAIVELSQYGLQRGTKTTITVDGHNLQDADGLLFDDARITARIVSRRDRGEDVPRRREGQTDAPIRDIARKTELIVEIDVPGEVEPGVHGFRVRTPSGTTALRTFAVGTLPELDETEMNDEPVGAQLMTLPMTANGALQRGGDADCYQFDAKAGQQIVFALSGTPIGSRLDSTLTVLDAGGAVVASNDDGAWQMRDSLLVHTFARDGRYTIRVADALDAGGPRDFHYRLTGGELPYVTSLFPLGGQRDTVTRFAVEGVHLGGGAHKESVEPVTVRLTDPRERTGTAAAMDARSADATATTRTQAHAHAQTTAPAQSQAQAQAHMQTQAASGAPALAVSAPVPSAARVQTARQTDTLPLTLRAATGTMTLNERRVARGIDPEIVETEASTGAARGQLVTWPITINGRLAPRRAASGTHAGAQRDTASGGASTASRRPTATATATAAAAGADASTGTGTGTGVGTRPHAGAVARAAGTTSASVTDTFRIRARKGQRVIFAVAAERFGSPLDGVLEVLDAAGRPIPRAIVRPVWETSVDLRDRGSVEPALRLLSTSGLRRGDYIFVDRELMQIRELPKGPDEDVQLTQFRGRRYSFEATSGESHANTRPVYKVEVHPPGTKLSPNGLPSFTLMNRNDDGGPVYGKDPYLDFTAPADGEYLVRLSDTRGRSGRDYAYRLTIAPPRPDFTVFLAPSNPNVPRGSRVPVTVSAFRHDGFDGPIHVKLTGLPAGVEATTGVILPGHTAVAVTLTATEDATPMTAPFSAVAEAEIDGARVQRTPDLERALPLVTIAAPPDVRVVSVEPAVIELEPGKRASVHVTIARGNGFAGRVPLNVLNLPFRLTVPDTGLNGILITEQQTARDFIIEADPAATPMEQTLYVTARAEVNSGEPTERASTPIVVRVRPAGATPTAAGAAAPAPVASKASDAPARQPR